MSKATLEFDMEKEKLEFEAAKDGMKYKSTIYALLSHLSKERRDQYITPTEIITKLNNLSLQFNLPVLKSMTENILKVK